VADQPAGAQVEPARPRIEKLFKILVREGASDLHLKVGQPPILRIKGALQHLKTDPLTDRQVERLFHEMVDTKRREVFEQRGSIDFAHEFGEGWRVRVNVFRQRGHISLACRLVQRHIPTFEELNLPPTLARIAEFPTGLVLMVGATGTGKSTTLAAMIEHINNTRRCHILTIEDPIEFSFTDKKSFINQREILLDVEDWVTALKYAMREDPDVIMVGEMRDPETFQAGLTAAETGHLVLGSMHAANCTQVVGRIMEMFPPDKHSMVRQSLSTNLRAMIAQMLLPSCKRGVAMVPAVEILLANPTVRSLIMRGEEHKLGEVIYAGRQEGMQDLTLAIADLVKKDMVLRKVAMELAPNREKLNMALRGIDLGAGKIIG